MVSSALAWPLLVGCGASPSTVGSGGVDGLHVPTPSPDPDDFVDGIDNPWLPLGDGAEWSYVDSAGAEIAKAVVGSEPRVVFGVSCRAVRWSGRIQRRTDWFAQDRAGNVWQLAGEAPGISWEGGRNGARAGLAMPAAPRRGDGFAVMNAPGVAEDRMTVTSIDARAPSDLPEAYADRLILLERRSSLDVTLRVREYYAREIGLVARTAEAGGPDELLLADHTGSGT